MNTRDPRPGEDIGGEPPDADMLAAEYVLGVADAPLRRQLQARIATDAQFAQRVQAWERHFAPWLDAIAPVGVPAQLWPRIRTQLGWSPVEGARRGVWQNAAFWRGATALAAAAAIAAMVIGRLPREPVSPPPAPRVAVQPPPVEQPKPVTTLAHEDGSPGWLASLDAVRGTVMMVPVPAPADAQGRVPELWLIPAGEAPRSLGLVSIDKAHSVAIPRALRRALTAGSILAITLEPPGGAPKGVPTGPIIAKGNLQAI